MGKRADKSSLGTLFPSERERIRHLFGKKGPSARLVGFVGVGEGLGTGGEVVGSDK